MNLNGTEYYYLYNGQRDVIGLYDASGNVVVEYTYDAWGKPLTTTGSLASTVGAKNPYRYRGYRYDTESGLYWLNSRYYATGLNRFLSGDDVLYLGYQGTILGCNLFAYCENKPVNRMDFTGHTMETSITDLWTSTMWWLIFIDATLPIGDSIYVLGVVIFVVIPILTLRADSSSSLPNQGDVIGNPEAPPVDAGAQGKHVIGHNNYIPGAKSA